MKIERTVHFPSDITVFLFHGLIIFFLRGNATNSYHRCAEIGLCIFVNHAPVMIVWCKLQAQETCRIWWMDNDLLGNPSLITVIQQAAQLFLEVHKEIMNKILLWETYKAFLEAL